MSKNISLKNQKGNSWRNQMKCQRHTILRSTDTNINIEHKIYQMCIKTWHDSIFEVWPSNNSLVKLRSHVAHDLTEAQGLFQSSHH